MQDLEAGYWQRSAECQPLAEKEAKSSKQCLPLKPGQAECSSVGIEALQLLGPGVQNGLLGHRIHVGRRVQSSHEASRCPHEAPCDLVQGKLQEEQAVKPLQLNVCTLKTDSLPCCGGPAPIFFSFFALHDPKMVARFVKELF